MGSQSLSLSQSRTYIPKTGERRVEGVANEAKG